MSLPPAPAGKHLWGTITIGNKGQIVIPKKARDTFNLKEGDRLVVLGDENEGIALVKAEAFVKITDLKPSHRTSVAASICEDCRTVVINY